MKKIEVIAIIILIIAVVCLLVIPRLYYQKKMENFTNNPAGTIDIITAIYNASVLEIGLLGGLIVLLGGLTMGLMISLRK
jgi:hypothetical protein